MPTIEPIYILGWVAFASVVTFFLYRRDKRLAQDGDPKRIAERTLLLWSLLGGWPGGWIASRIYRHKTRKLYYRIEFAVATLANVAAVAMWFLVSS